MREKALGLLLLLFAVCFVAIAIEETFLGGRRRRRLVREMRKRQETRAGADE